MMSILETVWRTVPWAHAVHYCEGDVLVVVRKRDRHRGLEGPEWNWRWDAELVQSAVNDELVIAFPDVAIKVIVV